MSCADRPRKEKPLFIAHEIGWTPEKDIEQAKTEAKIEVLEEVLEILDGSLGGLPNDAYDEGCYVGNREIYGEVEKILSNLKKKKK